ncbi:alpha/beta hydrolase fold-domain-containing protein [Lipomyces arxii]|uniref:alpha/beta hydrolase fold-domain-containing protein n=1 Tax=Lipomyces arxii TaxID=56418 RepID=UPI0034CE12C5
MSVEDPKLPAQVAAEVATEVPEDGTPVRRPVDRTPSLKDAMPLLKMMPYLTYEAVMHAASLRNAAHGWDLRSHLIVSMVRKYMSGSGKTIEELQMASKKGMPVEFKGLDILPLYIPKPTDSDCEFLSHAIITAKDKLTKDVGMPGPTIPDPEIVEVPAEWIVSSQKEKRADFICGENDVVIIYAHGGAHYLGSAEAHRFITGQFAESTKVNILSIDYRLSPQNPLPSALTDMLVSYLYVLETQHVPANHVFFAGDSSGGCLVLSMLEVILYSDDQAKRMHVPAGIVTISPWVDQSRCLPSESSKELAQFDYIPEANFYPNFKPSPSWPAENKRYWVSETSVKSIQ